MKGFLGNYGLWILTGLVWFLVALRWLDMRYHGHSCGTAVKKTAVPKSRCPR